MNQTKKYLVLFLALTMGLGTMDAYADCSASDKSSLLSCAHNSTLTCRNLFPTCNEPGQVATIQDTLTNASNRCCSIAGKNKKKRQTDCFKSYENQLNAASKSAPGILRNFLKKTRTSVIALRRAGCSTGSQ